MFLYHDSILIWSNSVQVQRQGTRRRCGDISSFDKSSSTFATQTLELMLKALLHFATQTLRPCDTGYWAFATYGNQEMPYDVPSSDNSYRSICYPCLLALRPFLSRPSLLLSSAITATLFLAIQTFATFSKQSQSVMSVLIYIPLELSGQGKLMESEYVSYVV